MNNQTMAALINKLQAPVIVSDILTGKDDTDETRYALSALISDMQPDEAVLAIALSMRNIVRPFLQASPALQMTEVECKRITEDYAHSWQHTPLAEQTDPADAADLLEQTCEDLEYLEELLNLNINYLNAKDTGGAELCKLLKAQASTHRMTAEAFTTALDQNDNNTVDKTLSIDTPATENILIFPNQ